MFPVAALLQPGVLRFRLGEDGDVGVGVFPEREEILIGRLRLGLVSRHVQRSPELELRERADRIADYDAAVIEDRLELRCGISASMCGQIGFATHVDRIQGSEESDKAAGRHAQFVDGRPFRS